DLKERMNFQRRFEIDRGRRQRACANRGWGNRRAEQDAGKYRCEEQPEFSHVAECLQDGRWLAGAPYFDLCFGLSIGVAEPFSPPLTGGKSDPLRGSDTPVRATPRGRR